QRLPTGLMNEVHKNVAVLEKELGKKFGDNANPLLVSVRSGAAVSMPGMMDTILNLGLTDAAVEGLAKATGNRRFAYDAYRRLFKSWNADRAVSYRRIQGIAGLTGTAVNVQAMVFGNMGDDSGTGVAFTRNPSTGENKFYGEFLINAQGEDVVAGIRTPKPVEEMGEWSMKSWKELLKIKDVLEKRYKDVQDFEFTIEKGKLYMLQTRNGKRTGAAAVRIAVEMVGEGLITKSEAVQRVDPQQ